MKPASGLSGLATWQMSELFKAQLTVQKPINDEDDSAQQRLARRSRARVKLKKAGPWVKSALQSEGASAMSSLPMAPGTPGSCQAELDALQIPKVQICIILGHLITSS